MTQIVLAQPGDLDALTVVIAEAFHDLPPSPWLISDDAERRRIFPGYFRIFAEHAMLAGTVHTTPGRDAAALWLPVVGEPPAPPEGYSQRLSAVTAPWTERFVQFDAALDSAHPTGFTHHYLAMLAVRPDRQGQGIGTALLRFCHGTLDRSSTPAFLEASSLRNRGLYLRHGYADHGPAIQLPGGPVMYPMARQPRRRGRHDAGAGDRWRCGPGHGGGSA